MANFSISNHVLQVEISALGAEIQSIYNKETALEYMWSGDPAFWPKKSPALFPVVGGLKNNSYQFEDKNYSLGRHGFARESLFTVTQHTSESICFNLLANEATLAVYPFDFSFSIVYTIKENQLHVNYLVENIGDKTLYFSVGAHPAFKVPLTEGSSYNDYYLLFNETETAGQYPLSSDGLIEQKTIPFFDNTNTLPLTKSLFYADALVFKNLNATNISILSNKSSHGLKLHYPNFPYMGIWSFKDADFVCIEPWCGITDMVNTDGNIVNKEGINTLEPKELFSRTWWVELF